MEDIDQTVELRLYQRVPGTTNVVRPVADPVRRKTPSSSFAWISYALLRYKSRALVLSSTSVITKQTTWYELGKVVVADMDMDGGCVRTFPVEIPRCFVYDGPENLTKADLPPGVVVKEHLMEKVVFEARLDGGDHILMEMREADLLHKAYMVAKATKE
jgi:hypothetical protein